jgi:hypothetical protein
LLITEVRFKEYVRENIEGACLEAITAPDHYVIARSLAVGGIEYTFYTDQNRFLRLDVALLGLINLGGGDVLRFEGEQVLQVEEPRLLGYQLWHVDGLLGPESPEIIVENLTKEDVVELKKGPRQ